jgi:hypothetical protein
VYFRAQDFHLHELRLEPRQPWQAADLTALTNTPDAAEGEPFAYNAFPGESMSIEVLYRARDSHLYKLSQGFQQPWSVLDVTASSGALNAAGSPFASVTNIRSSRPTSRIIYRGVDNHLHEIRLERQAWKAADLTADSGASDVVGDPRACVVWEPLQDMARVVFHTADHHLHELRLAISNSD